MFQDDRKNFDHELCKRWKGKFDKGELDRWWRRSGRGDSTTS
jgi:hypothetical protein